MDSAKSSVQTKTNQHGQILGRKGHETRQRLMAATRKLLEIYSPVELTAVSIAKEAKTSSASFYMYFEDVRDILYALAVQAGADMDRLIQEFESPWDESDLLTHALSLVETLGAIWDQHRTVLRFRNMEADRGDPRFEALRMSTYIPFIDALARRIISMTPADKPRPSLGQAFALASVVHSAMERLASTDPAVVARGVGIRKLNEALTHVIGLVFHGGGFADVPAGASAKPIVAKAIAVKPVPAKDGAAKPPARKRAAAEPEAKPARGASKAAAKPAAKAGGTRARKASLST